MGVHREGRKMTITCGECGQEAAIDAWTRTPVSGELPRGQYQCPRCGYAFQRREVTPGQVYRLRGELCRIPGKIRLVPCDSRL